MHVSKKRGILKLESNSIMEEDYIVYLREKASMYGQGPPKTRKLDATHEPIGSGT